MEPMQEQYQAGKVPSTVQEIPGRGETLQSARRRVNQALSDADEAVHQNPWASIGIGFGLGVVVGALVALAASRDA